MYQHAVEDGVFETVESEYTTGVDALNTVFSPGQTEQLAEYERENNPISGFLEENDIDSIVNNSTNDVYAMYQIFCNEGNHTPLSKVVFSRQINERLGTEVVVKCIKGKSVRVFVQRRF